MFQAQRQAVLNLIRKAKRAHFSAKINENATNPKALFAVIDHLLHRKKDTPLPRHHHPSELAESFSSFFQNKITNIRAALDTQPLGLLPPVIPLSVTSHLTEFTPVTPDDVLKLINKSAAKSCGLDPMPSSLVKEHATILAPVITQIVNGSLLTGDFPSEFKQAVVTPLLKNSSLDPDVLNHYRPVSNLHYISKLVEKVVAKQLSQYLLANNLYEPYQSAYRTHHSTESALVRVSNDILQAIDNRQSVILVLLDMSAAFDTIDHDILLNMLDKRYGLRGTVHQWFRSYLSGRSQTVFIHGTSSNSKPLFIGVPQGSVLGPVLFTLYSAPIADIARRHGLRVHLYADDTQLYIPFSSGETAVTVARVERCVAEIKDWLVAHKLKLNDDKTIIMEIFSPRTASTLSGSHLQVGEEYITLSETARNLGVVVDQHLSMHDHINKVCRSAYYHLRNIARVRTVVPQMTAETLVHAFITSRLDYCNALLYGLPAYAIDQLQSVQNAAARVVTRSRKHDHITPILHDLHWLPVQQRISFKILMMTWRALNGLAPDYISELIIPYVPGRRLRSANDNLLAVPSSRLRTYGDRRFAHAAPTLWNALPLAVRGAQSLTLFKRLLKTHLFSEHFNMNLANT